VPDVFAHIGNWTDLLVLQRDPDTAWGSPYDLGALVLRVDIPCIVLPPDVREARLECIALAWNGAPEAVRAIHAALPLLQRAQRVVLLSGERRDSFIEIGWKPPFEIEVYLGRHGIVPERTAIVVDKDHAGTALLETAAQVDADLLVMGAYGRSRFSEWAFGGATRQVLHDAALPVFLRH
jgi:nucleotide-binding universal stress UspA family protein